jgi:hypothetical protein
MYIKSEPIPVAALSKVRVGGRSYWVCGFESRWGHECLSFVSVVFCQLKVSASGWSLVQRSATECGVSEYDREAWIRRRPWPTRGCCVIEKYKTWWWHIRAELISELWTIILLYNKFVVVQLKNTVICVMFRDSLCCIFFMCFYGNIRVADSNSVWT